MNMESNVEKIILVREDGSQEVITRGLVADYTEAPASEEGTVSVDMCGMSGKDVMMIIMSMVELGFKLGIIGHDSEKEELDND